MARFRKKPVEIEAFQWNGGPDQSEDPEWIVAAIRRGDVYYQGGENPYLTIETLEGKMRASVGDWIIQGIKGEIYPCKPAIFEATYELSDVADEDVEDQNRWWEFDPNVGDFVFTKTEDHIFATYRGADAQRIGDMSRDDLIAVIAVGYYERDLLAVACKAALEDAQKLLTKATIDQLVAAVSMVTPYEESPG